MQDGLMNCFRYKFSNAFDSPFIAEMAKLGNWTF